MGVGSQYLADYRGSARYQAIALPFPFVKFTTRYFEVDRDKLKSEIIATERWALNLSADASITINADDNPLREGMPELHPYFELGPSFDINLSGDAFSEGWSLRLPLRAVTAVDLSEQNFESAGFLFNPKLTHQSYLNNNWQLKTDVGFLFGDKSYHDYFYSVEQQYVLQDRPYFAAKKGYSGLYLKGSLKRRVEDWWLRAYLRADLLDGAAFEASPLVESDYYFTLGIGVAKAFAKR